MFKKNLGDVVAADMDSILKSDEFELLFGKKAAKCKCDDDCKQCKKGDCDDCPKCCKEDDDKEEAKKDKDKDDKKEDKKDKKDDDKDKKKKKKCTCDCKKCEEGDCDKCKKCDCGKKDDDDDDKGDTKALDDIAQHLIRLSADLDDLNFGRSSAGVLSALDTMVSEAQTQIEIIDDTEVAVPEERAEEMLEELAPELLGGMEGEGDLISTLDEKEHRGPGRDFLSRELDRPSGAEGLGELEGLEDDPDAAVLSEDFIPGDEESMTSMLSGLGEEAGVDTSLEGLLQMLEEEGAKRPADETALSLENLSGLSGGGEEMGADDGAIASLSSDLDKWLSKNADKELKDHFSGETVVDFELSADLKELITADDNLEQQLVNLAADKKDEDEEDEDEEDEDE